VIAIVRKRNEVWSRFIVVALMFIAKIDKVCVKFSFLTETLTLPRYDEGRKSERVMKNELVEWLKSRTNKTS
jgi:hypothetical protein